MENITNYPVFAYGVIIRGHSDFEISKGEDQIAEACDVAFANRIALCLNYCLGKSNEELKNNIYSFKEGL